MVPEKLPALLSSPRTSVLSQFGKVPLYLVMVVPLLIQVLGAVAVVGWLSYRNGQQAVNEVATQLRNESGGRIRQHLDDYLSTPIQINRTNADAFELGLLDLKNFQTTGKYFWRQMQIFNVGFISFGNPRGDFIGVERHDNGRLLINEKSAQTNHKLLAFSADGEGDRMALATVSPNYNPLVEGWYVDALKVKQPSWSSIYQWEDRPNVLSISANYPLYDRRNRLIGVLSVDQILTQISEFLSRIRVSQTGVTYIMEGSGNLVASSTTEKPFRLVEGKALRLAATDSQNPLIRSSARYLSERFSSLQQIRQPQQLDYPNQDERQFLLVMPWQDSYGLNWWIVVVVPESDFMAQITQNTWNTILACAIALALATLIGIPTSRWIARQILHLSQASEALADGHLNQTVQARGITELETLAKSFNRMAQQLRESFATLEQTNEQLEQRVEERTASLAATEAELRALFAAMTDLVIVYDRQGRFQKMVSARAHQLIRPLTEQVGKTVHEMFPASQSDLILGAIHQALETKQVVNVEYFLPLEDQKIWFSANVSPLSDETVIWVARDISERKRIEDERKKADEILRVSQEKFAKAFSSSPDFITISNIKTGRFVEVNESFLRASGYTREEVMGKTVFDLGAWVNRNDRAKLRHLLTEAGRVHDQEVELRKKTGEIMIGLMSGEIIELEGEPCLLAVTKDITDRKQAEAAIRESQQKYRDLVESANSIILRWDTNGQITFLNQYGQQFFGYQEDEILGRPVVGSLLPTASPSGWDWQVLMSAICDDPVHYQDNEYQHTRSNGEKVWVKWSNKAILNDQGEFVEILSVGFDITDRKRAEAALQEKEQYLRLILNNIPQQVFWKDTNLVFLGCNRNWSQAAQLNAPEEIIGKTDYDVLPNAELAEQYRARDRHIIDTEIPSLHTIEPKVKSEDGNTIWLDVSRIPIHDARQKVIGVLGVIEDITQRKQAEEALQAEQEKSESLLLNVLPRPIAERLKQSLNHLQERNSRALIAESYDEVTVMFADIVNFTTLSANVSAADLVGLLNRIFLMFDELSEKYGLEKIKTIGDAYMVVGGLPNPRPDHAAAIANMALEMQQEIRQFKTYEGQFVEVRVGINTGPVIAGVIGKKKFTYDLWGDVVNTASRMESHGAAGRIQVTEVTYQQLKEQYIFEPRGAIEVKGKGEMFTYWLTGHKAVDD